MIRLFSLPARRHTHNTVSAQVNLMEPRALLSGVAIFPQSASVKPQAAAPANFSGPWSLSVENESAITGMTLNQTGTEITGVINAVEGDPVEIPITNGSVKKKTLTLFVDRDFVSFDIKLKLKGNGTLKGTFVSSNDGAKQKVTGSQAS